MQDGGHIAPDTKQLVGGRLLVPSVAKTETRASRGGRIGTSRDAHEKLPTGAAGRDFRRPERRCDPSEHVKSGPAKGENPRDTINPAVSMTEPD